jgi:hypothetical protein
MKRWLLACSLLISVSAHAGQPPVPFPGAALFPLASLGTDDEVVRNLYEGRLFVPGTAYPVCQPDCKLTVKGQLHWTDHGENHFGLVVVAEGDNAAHASGALIGMVDLMQTPAGWIINAGSPIVAQEGAFGSAPNMQVISAGIFGMAVATMPGFTNQGETEQNWNLYVERDHVFQQALSLPMTEDNSGRCDDAKCREHDFTSKTVVSDDGATGLIVRMTRTLHDGRSAFRDYQIMP